MSYKQEKVEDILVKGLSHILKRTIEVDPGDQEYREWINCISTSDFSKQEILVIDKFTFN